MKESKKMKTILYRRVAIIVVLLLCMVGLAAADNYVGGLPLTTVQSGTVNGGVYVDANTPDWGSKDVQKTFTSIPDVNNIQWARLYVAVYDGQMQDNRQGTVAVSFDGNGDGTYETALGTETLNVPFVYITNGGNDNTGQGGGLHDPYKKVNDHMNRVTSDYLMWYDVTDEITSQTPKAHVVTTAIDGSFDGRIKLITLVVAYNDGDTDTIYYRVNQGHDADTYYADSGGVYYKGSTDFDLSSLSGTVQSATLTVNHMASSDGLYNWYGTPIDRLPDGGTTPPGSSSQGAYFGWDIWDMTSLVSLGDSYDLQHSRSGLGGSGEFSGQFYKIPLAVLTVKKQPPMVAPTADFSATPLAGTTPLNVQFTDLSTGPPTSWAWYYRYRPSGGSWGNMGTTPFATTKNPSYAFSGVGDYIIKLTATNSMGSNSKTRGTTTVPYFTVSPAASIDLTVTEVKPDTSTVFARESNSVKTIVRNIGGGASPVTKVNLVASDGFSGSSAVPALASNEETTITIVDTTNRNLAGGTVTYTATVDPSNAIAEGNEANNAMSSSYTVAYNGYKGKHYWDGGSDVTTKKTFDLHGNLLYSPGDSVYRAGGAGGASWNDYTVTWTGANLPVPAGATVREVRLYVPYTWDSSGQIPDHFSATFNGHTLTRDAIYTDKSNFGGYANYVYGLLAYNVTSDFQTSGNNVIIHKDTATSNLAMYGLTLAVVYEKADEPQRQIFLNEEFDLLGADDTMYATVPQEATAYVPFSGMTTTPANVASANLITFVPSGNGPEGILLFNGNTLGTNVWDYGLVSGTQVAIDTRDVKSTLTATGNEVGIRSTPGATPCMAAAQEFLVVTYNVVSNPDLVVTAITPNVGGGDNMFANEPNVFSVTVKNQGTAAAAASKVSVADGSSTATTAVGALAVGASTTVTVTDPALNAGVSIASITATADSAGVIAEADETNNALTVSLTVYNNGFKGKRWTGGSDMNTQAGPFEGHIDVVYSAGNTAYNSAVWTAKTYTWSSTDLPIPAGATITSARLYQGYTWDQTSGGSPLWTMTFNGATVTPAATYTDRKGYGTYDYPQGQYVYDVTGPFNPAGNSMTITPQAGNNNAIYGAYLVVVYTDNAGESQKKIWINDECDEIYAGTARSVSSAEATAYANFTSVSTTDIANAKAIAILQSAGDSGKSKFFFNSNEYTGFWADYKSSPQIGFSVYDVTSALGSGSNEARFQSYDSGSGGDNMYATNVILIVEKNEAPVAAFTWNPTSPDRGTSVSFDASTSTGSITSYTWNFGDSSSGSGVTVSHAYTTAGDKTVRLTVSGPLGSNYVEHTVHVREPAPVVTFTPASASGPVPLTVNFAATNNGGAVTTWTWEYKLSSDSTWTAFGTNANTASKTFTPAGIYDVRVTAAGPDYTFVETHTGMYTAGSASIAVSVGSPTILFGTMSTSALSTGSTSVTVDTTSGNGWSVTAADLANGGKMKAGTTVLTNGFQVTDSGGSTFNDLSTLTGNAFTFMSGSGTGTNTGTANVKQAIGSGDAPGDYAITVTFTGGFS